MRRIWSLDAATGTVKWATQGRDGNHASILHTNEHLVLLTDAATLVVARRSSDGFMEERRIDLGTGATWTLPVFLPDGLLVRDLQRHLVVVHDGRLGGARVAGAARVGVLRRRD